MTNLLLLVAAVSRRQLEVEHRLSSRQKK